MRLKVREFWNTRNILKLSTFFGIFFNEQIISVNAGFLCVEMQNDVSTGMEIGDRRKPISKIVLNWPDKTIAVTKVYML